MNISPELNALEVELAGVQEDFATLKTTAEGCCNSVRRAADLAAKLNPASISDPALRKRAEGLSKTTQELRGFEAALNKQLESTRQPLQSLESFQLRKPAAK